MKRSMDTVLPSTPTKRRRASPTEHQDTLDSDAFELFSDPSRECTIEDALRDGINPDFYIPGCVTMRLLPQDGHTWFILKTSSGRNVKAEFRGKCAPHLELLKGTFKEEVKLRLKGATVIHPESGDTLTLLYEQGASLVLVKSRDSARVGKVIDTWSRKHIHSCMFSTSSLAHGIFRRKLTELLPKRNRGRIMSTATIGTKLHQVRAASHQPPPRRHHLQMPKLLLLT